MQMQRTEKQLIKENVYSIFAQAIQQASGVHQNWNRKRGWTLELHVRLACPTDDFWKDQARYELIHYL